MKHGNTEAHEIKNVCNSKKTKKKQREFVTY